MNPEENNFETIGVSKEKHSVFQVTKLSKYLAMSLFILMPFLGGWIGYQYAPEKVVEVEKVMVQEVEEEQDADLEEGFIEVEESEFANEDLEECFVDFSGTEMKDVGHDIMLPVAADMKWLGVSGQFGTIFFLDCTESPQYSSLTTPVLINVPFFTRSPDCVLIYDEGRLVGCENEDSFLYHNFEGTYELYDRAVSSLASSSEWSFVEQIENPAVSSKPLVVYEDSAHEKIEVVMQLESTYLGISFKKDVPGLDYHKFLQKFVDLNVARE